MNPHIFIYMNPLSRSAPEVVACRCNKYQNSMYSLKWASTRQNLSSGFLTKWDTNESAQLQRLARNWNFTKERLDTILCKKANYKDASQTGWICILVCIFVVRKPIPPHPKEALKTSFLALKPNNVNPCTAEPNFIQFWKHYRSGSAAFWWS